MRPHLLYLTNIPLSPEASEEALATLVAASEPFPYELHVTVRNATPVAFRVACLALGVKPIFLALQNRAGADVMREVMTSSVHRGDDDSVMRELERIVCGLASAGYDVVRQKVETVPWHPAAPTASSEAPMPAGSYFEAHLNVIICAASAVEEARQRTLLEAMAEGHGAHLSRNVFKQLSATTFTVMLTLRNYTGTREQFESQRDALEQALGQSYFLCEKVITEFSLFDSKVQHDQVWLTAH